MMVNLMKMILKLLFMSDLWVGVIDLNNVKSSIQLLVLFKPK